MLSYDHILLRLTEVLQATTQDGLVDVFEQIVAEAGGTGFAVAVMPAPDDLHVNYSRGLNGYSEHYETSRFVLHCPVTRRLATATYAFRWNDVQVADDDHMGRVVLEVASDFGIKDGLVVPMRMRDGQKGCVFAHVPERELREPAQQWLTMLCMAFHSRLMQLSARTESGASRLSDREREVLRWMAQGKSADDVAEILGISAATVMFHYRNVAVRYGTLNRTHTVVEALRRGGLAIG